VSETDLVTAGTAPESGAPDTTGGSAAPARRKGLSTMVLAELRQLAGELNIADTAKMRKGDLIAAIKERQAGGPAPQLPLPETAAPSTNGAGTAESPVDEAPAPTRRRRVASRPAGSPRKGAAAADGDAQATSGEAAGAPVEVPAAEVAPPVEPAPEVAAPTVAPSVEPTPEVAAAAQPAEAPTDPVTPAAV
jgi:transcription termination factor Rho